uniref:FBD domain-containing protein n=1 Tax=Oryza glumipatula TaxID=40148 RepID=A0A0D9YBA1_9ORYZ
MYLYDSSSDLEHMDTGAKVPAQRTGACWRSCSQIYDGTLKGWSFQEVELLHMDHRENQAFHGGAQDVHGKGHVIGIDQREQLNLRAADEQPVKVISLSVALAQDELPQARQEDGFAGPQGQLLRWLAKERDSVAHHGGAGEDLGREGGGTAHATEVHNDEILDVVIAFQGTDPIPEAVVAVEAGDGESDGVEGAWGTKQCVIEDEGHKSLDPSLGMGEHHWRQACGTQGREELGWELADAGSIRWGSGVGGGWRRRKPIEDPQSTQLDDFEFWEEINSAECVRSSIKKVVFHGFSWKNSEIAFINSIAEGGLVLEKICIFQSRHGTAPDDDDLNAKLSMVASLNIGHGRTEIIFSGEDPTWCSRAAADLSRADPSNGNDLSYFHSEMFLPFNCLKKIFNTI